jgi:hypothetical protein
MTAIVGLVSEYGSTCIWRFSDDGTNLGQLSYAELPLPPQLVVAIQEWADRYFTVAEESDEAAITQFSADGAELARKLKHVLGPAYRVVFCADIDDNIMKEIDEDLRLRAVDWTAK